MSSSNDKTCDFTDEQIVSIEKYLHEKGIVLENPIDSTSVPFTDEQTAYLEKMISKKCQENSRAHSDDIITRAIGVAGIVLLIGWSIFGYMHSRS